MSILVDGEYILLVVVRILLFCCKVMCIMWIGVIRKLWSVLMMEGLNLEVLGCGIGDLRGICFSLVFILGMCLWVG